MGIEPTAQAWEAWVLPLYDARAPLILVGLHSVGKSIIQRPKKVSRIPRNRDLQD